MSSVSLERVEIRPPEGVQLIIGQSHFIKSVEDLYEAIASSMPKVDFGVAFCESSGPALVRHEGSSEELEKLAVEYALKISAGHVFIVVLRNAYPVNVLNRIKSVEEVATVFCATGNPVDVIIAETMLGRGVLGVVDGVKTKGVENEEDKKHRREFLRRIGYKK
ncbi:MAG: adenosine-specific kinase [Candidatus Brockarchaeota archaeon]|nr:adenosine-specific kinase [Candidatus Brockarchaeota archaeon]